jgi:micrococcal nuclease
MPGRIRSAALAAALLAASCNEGTCAPPPPARRALARDGPFDVARIVDGDTIHVRTDTGVHRVRLLCIDTPEVRGRHRSPLGDEATRALVRLLGNGGVYLDDDPAHQQMDRHGRLLRHVFLEDSTHVNVEMVRRGHSAYYLKYGPCPRHDEAFRTAEAAARRADAGIWSHPRFLRRYLPNARGR